MSDRDRQRRDDLRLRHAQSLADELRDHRSACVHQPLHDPRTVILVDFCARRVVQPDAFGFPDDVC
jgi:hypothetical protein